MYMKCRCGKLQIFAHCRDPVLVPKTLRRGIFTPGMDQSQRVGQVEWGHTSPIHPPASPRAPPCHTPPSGDALLNFIPSLMGNKRAPSVARQAARVEHRSPGLLKAVHALQHWSHFDRRSYTRSKSHNSATANGPSKLDRCSSSRSSHAATIRPPSQTTAIRSQSSRSVSRLSKVTARSMPIRRILSRCCHSVVCVDQPLFGGRITIMAHPADCLVEKRTLDLHAPTPRKNDWSIVDI